MENEKFYLNIDFDPEGMDIDLHANYEQIASGIIAVADNLPIEIIGGIVGGLNGMIKVKSEEMEKGTTG